MLQDGELPKGFNGSEDCAKPTLKNIERENEKYCGGIPQIAMRPLLTSATLGKLILDLLKTKRRRDYPP